MRRKVFFSYFLARGTQLRFFCVSVYLSSGSRLKNGGGGHCCLSLMRAHMDTLAFEHNKILSPGDKPRSAPSQWRGGTHVIATRDYNSSSDDDIIGRWRHSIA
jgi:hypothetical protein